MTVAFGPSNTRVYGKLITPLASAERSAGSGNSPVYTTDEYHTARLTLDVTAVTAGSVDAKLQTSNSTGSGWRDVEAFTQQTGVASERKSFSGLDRYIRVNYTVTTGPATFSVSGELA